MQVQVGTTNLNHSTPTKSSKRNQLKKWFHSFYDKPLDDTPISQLPTEFIDISLDIDNSSRNLASDKQSNDNSILPDQYNKTSIRKHLKKNFHKFKLSNNYSNAVNDVNNNSTDIEDYIKNMKEPSTCFDKYHTNTNDLNELFDHSMGRVFSGNILNESSVFQNYYSRLNAKHFHYQYFNDRKNEYSDIKEYKNLRFISIDETMLNATSGNPPIIMKDNDSSLDNSDKLDNGKINSKSESDVNSQNNEDVDNPIYDSDKSTKELEPETGFNSIIKTPNKYLTGTNDIENAKSDNKIEAKEKYVDDINSYMLDSIPSSKAQTHSGIQKIGKDLSDSDELPKPDYYIFNSTESPDSGDSKEGYSDTETMQLRISNAAKRCSYDVSSDTLTIHVVKNELIDEPAQRDAISLKDKESNEVEIIDSQFSGVSPWNPEFNDDLNYFQDKVIQDIENKRNLHEKKFIISYY
ncbi:hypothetical protein TPHA_0M00920 [Tetrapisispora phaffii CBS 4417]|uniref:Uncharacterized protein n=1 Tax=Tetrapisispora phaffii (strain ATCC 24235 / CBS 4417 / NBRC 1672 / NRRL Y-8282 / UCD 70-5) TaxID=1071381 RepID=G8C0F2_TETPH|nr:hypothetical protein TPHA_0M00920 [Tetrapisispora phaffii CBS 4417]CCE65667.1 hypothetical protein TPHA_0M00920 [Tetrapisispora phaffii CBS 4417]